MEYAKIHFLVIQEDLNWQVINHMDNPKIWFRTKYIKTNSFKILEHQVEETKNLHSKSKSHPKKGVRYRREGKPDTSL